MPSDTERLDWLEKQGSGIALLHDDVARWAVSQCGMQPIEDEHGLITDRPISGVWSNVVERHEWRNSVREAIDAAMETEQEDEA